MIDLGRLSRARKLALIAAAPVILIGTYWVIVFPGTADYPEPSADIPAEMQRLAQAARASSTSHPRRCGTSRACA